MLFFFALAAPALKNLKTLNLAFFDAFWADREKSPISLSPFLFFPCEPSMSCEEPTSFRPCQPRRPAKGRVRPLPLPGKSARNPYAPG